MSFVAVKAVPTPTIRTPSVHACGVINGSCPMVRVKTQAASTETANWNQRKAPVYAKEAAHG